MAEGDDSIEVVAHLTAEDEATPVIEGVGQAVEDAASKGEDASNTLGHAAEFAIGGLLVEGFNKASEAVTEFLNHMVEAGTEAEDTETRLGAMIKATGDASGMTAEGANKLADQYRDLAGGEKDAVLGAESVLMRFTTITGDTFPKATEATLNLAAMMGTSASSAAMVLGRALESPGTALNRLRAAGVVFTKEQIDQMKQLTATGHAAEAQQMILDALGKTTGGFAAEMAGTFSGRLKIMQGHLNGIFEEIGSKLLPIFEPMLSSVTQLVDAFAEWATSSNGLQPIIEQLGSALAGIFTAALPLLHSILESLPSMVSGFAGVATSIAGFLASLQPVFAILQQHVPEIVAGLTAFGAALAIAFGAGAIAAVIAFIGPILGIIAVVGAVVVIIGVLAAAWAGNWGGIRDTLTSVWEGTLQPAFQKVADWLSVQIPAAIATVSNFWTGTLLPAMTAVWNWMSTVLFPFLQALANFISAVLSVALTALAGIFQNVILPALQSAFHWLAEVLQPAFDNFNRLIGGPVMGMLKSLGEGIGNWITAAIKTATEALNTLATTLSNLKLPDWMTPHSPTDWEVGLLGVSGALRLVNDGLSTMNSQTTNLDQSSRTNSTQFNLNIYGGEPQSQESIVQGFNFITAASHLT